MTIEELNQKIRLAFADVPYPGDDNLGLPQGGDEGELVIERFCGRTWQSLNSDDLWSLELRFMIPAAYHYYFPAFMLVLEDESNGNVNDLVIDEITPPFKFTLVENDQWDKFVLKFQDFSTAQKAVIGCYGEYRFEEQLRSYAAVPAWGNMNSDEERKWQRLRKYWGQFLEEADA